MKVIEHLQNTDRTLISFEIIPPKRGGNISQLMAVLDDLEKYKPPFIDITSHAAEIIYEEQSSGGFQMKVKRKRPGTLGICALIQNKYNIDAVPHVICQGFTKEETEDFLIELTFLGIDNVLAIRGDDSGYRKPLPHGRTANIHAVDLVSQINELNQGHYLEDGLLDAQQMNFCVGVGGYPEKHFEAPNIKTDIKYTKDKVDAGAEYIVTQMFYDNKKYFEYVENCRAAGIDVPIIPGLKLITAKSQLTTIPKNFFIDIPDEFAGEILEAKDEHILDISCKWTYRQVEELLNADVPAIHFYIMQKSNPIKHLLDKLDI